MTSTPLKGWLILADHLRDPLGVIDTWGETQNTFIICISFSVLMAFYKAKQNPNPVSVMSTLIVHHLTMGGGDLLAALENNNPRAERHKRRSMTSAKPISSKRPQKTLGVTQRGEHYHHHQCLHSSLAGITWSLWRLAWTIRPVIRASLTQGERVF